MRGKIEIELEVSDEHVAQDIIWMLEMQLPYIADNVIVRSSWGDELHRVYDMDDGTYLSVQFVDDGVIYDLYGKNGMQMIGTEGHTKNEIYERLTEGLRSCDECGRWTDAGAYPDWVNGVCEECDPSILEDEPRGDDMTEEDADLHERDTLRRENPIRDLILKAWEAGKLRYQKEEPDLDRPVILDYSTTGMSGIEFQYNPEDDRILFAMRSIDGIDVEVDDLIEMMDREVNDGNLQRTWVVTEKTCVEAISEEQAISRVVNRVGNQEVIEMTAELGEE